jgi:hypothetical protein
MRLGNKPILILSFIPFLSLLLLITSLGSGAINIEHTKLREVGLGLMGLSIALPFAVLQYLNPRESGGVFGYGIYYYSKDKETSFKKAGLIGIVIIFILYVIGLILFLL